MIVKKNGDSKEKRKDRQNPVVKSNGTNGTTNGFNGPTNDDSEDILAFNSFHFESILNATQEIELKNTMSQILQPGKGLLIVDESSEEIEPHIREYELRNTPECRRRYRQLLFTIPNLSQYVSGVVLHDETFHQNTEKGESFLDLLRRQNVIVGIRADTGFIPLSGTLNEPTTQGIDNLAQRIQNYKRGGCKFAKWSCSYVITKLTPSHLVLTENANLLARFASICQNEGVVPVIDCVISNQGQHSLTHCQAVTESVWAHVFKALSVHNVLLEGVILGANLVTQGCNVKHQSSVDEVIAATLTAFRRTVPVAVPGIALSASAHSPISATQYLNVINQLSCERIRPWRVTFGFGFELHAQVLQIWSGQGENVRAAQETFEQRAKANSEAEKGKYTSEKAITNLLLSTTAREQIKPYY